MPKNGILYMKIKMNYKIFKRVVYKTTLLLYDDYGKRFPKNIF